MMQTYRACRMDDERISEGARKFLRMLVEKFVDDIDEWGMSRDDAISGIIDAYQHGFLKIRIIGDSSFDFVPCDPEDAPQLRGPLSFETMGK